MSPDNLLILMRGILATVQNERMAPAQRLSIIASAAQGALGVLAASPTIIGLAVEAPKLDTMNHTAPALQSVITAEA